MYKLENIMYILEEPILKCLYMQKLENIMYILEEPIVRCFSHGQSNPTYFIRYGGKDMVLRKKPVSQIFFKGQMLRI